MEPFAKFSVHSAYVASGRYIQEGKRQSYKLPEKPPLLISIPENDPKDRKDQNDRNDTKIMSFESQATKKPGPTGACRIFRAIARIKKQKRNTPRSATSSSLPLKSCSYDDLTFAPPCNSTPLFLHGWLSWSSSSPGAPLRICCAYHHTWLLRPVSDYLGPLVRGLETWPVNSLILFFFFLFFGLNKRSIYILILTWSSSPVRT